MSHAGFAVSEMIASSLCSAVGVSFLGPRWSEPRLLGLAYAFEQSTMARRPPDLLPSITTSGA